MACSQSYAFTLALIFFLEYWLKQWWETIDTKISKPVWSYFFYRLIHLVLLFSIGPFLYAEIDLVQWIVYSASFVLLGSLEIFLTMVNFRIKQWTGIDFYQLNYLVPLFIAVLSLFVDYRPLYDIDYRMVFLFVFLAHPSNYLIRWALNKDEPSLSKRTAFSILQTLLGQKFTFTPEIAATASDAGEARLKAGRRIGTLERWLILLLIGSNNVSSMGLVIAAKSIVRYPQLSDPEFAEYYLLGTLFSVVLALASSFLVLGGF